MTKEMVVKKNLDLLQEFHRYAVDNPDILDQIPREAQLIILPDNDPELLKANQRTIQECKKAKRPFVAFRMKFPKPSIPRRVEAA